jgi:hypothetical protein
VSRLSIVAALVVAAGAALAIGPAPRPLQTRVQLVGGTLAMSNSKDGAAILKAAGMAPGDTRAGEVTISNTGDLAGAYSLSQSDLADSPGPAGGALSTALDVLVQDVTNPSAPATVYSGKLAAMSPLALGTWPPGTTRTYRFTVSLPNGGATSSATTGDNAYQGSAVSVRYDWTATSDGASAQLRVPRLLVTGRKRQRLLRQKGVVVFARCSTACSLKATAKGKGAAKRIRLSAWKGQAGPGVRVKIKLRLSRKAVKATKQALRRGRRRATMTVTVRATAATGSSTLRRLKVSVR